MQWVKGWISALLVLERILLQLKLVVFYRILRQSCRGFAFSAILVGQILKHAFGTWFKVTHN